MIKCNSNICVKDSFHCHVFFYIRIFVHILLLCTYFIIELNHSTENLLSDFNFSIFPVLFDIHFIASIRQMISSYLIASIRQMITSSCLGNYCPYCVFFLPFILVKIMGKLSQTLQTSLTTLSSEQSLEWLLGQRIQGRQEQLVITV